MLPFWREFGCAGRAWSGRAARDGPADRGAGPPVSAGAGARCPVALRWRRAVGPSNGVARRCVTVAPGSPSVAYILIVLTVSTCGRSGTDRAKVTCGIEAGWGTRVVWSKLIALAFLISCALTTAYIALWWFLR
jgi:hypothetical protein